MKMSLFNKIVLFVSLALAYLKTAEALVQFAPRSFMGWSDPVLPVLWAYISALLVEGVAYLAVTNLISMTKDTPTRTVSWVVAGVAVSFSLVMNIIDQKITDGSFVGGQGTPIGGFLYQAMGLIPIFVAILFALILIVDAAVPDKDKGGGNKQRGGGGWSEMPQRSEMPPRPQGLPEPRLQERPGGYNGTPNSGRNGVQSFPQAQKPNRSFGNERGQMPTLAETQNGEHPTPPA